MNKRIKELALQAMTATTIKFSADREWSADEWRDFYDTKFAELIVEDVLDQVKERAYYTGDRDWSDDVDRPWIQLEFGYGKLAEAQK